VRVYQFRHIREPASSEHTTHPAESPQGTTSARAAQPIGLAPYALVASILAPLSSRGLGRRPLMAETRVRIPVAVLQSAPQSRVFVVWVRLGQVVGQGLATKKGLAVAFAPICGSAASRQGLWTALRSSRAGGSSRTHSDIRILDCSQETQQSLGWGA
jgi:hypothetical protein